MKSKVAPTKRLLVVSRSRFHVMIDAALESCDGRVFNNSELIAAELSLSIKKWLDQQPTKEEGVWGDDEIKQN